MFTETDSWKKTKNKEHSSCLFGCQI